MHLELFTQPLCPYSRILKHVLNILDVPFIERDIVSDREARKDFVHTGSKILPVLRDQNVVIEGFHPEKLRYYLYARYGIVMPRWVDDLAVHRFHHLVTQSTSSTIFVVSPLSPTKDTHVRLD